MANSNPLVYDIRDGSYNHFTHTEFRQWAIGQGLDLADVYRIEVHRADPPYARATAYLLDASGHRYCGLDHDHRGPASCKPADRTYDVPITSMPPQLPAKPKGA